MPLRLSIPFFLIFDLHLNEKEIVLTERERKKEIDCGAGLMHKCNAL